MNKKSVLKALKDLREDAKNHIPYHTEYLNERLDTIENVITNYFVYKQDYERVMREKNSLLKEYAKSQKEHKALEVIKKRNVDIALLKASRNKQEYDQRLCRRVNYGIESDQKLTYIVETQEEYDLLKEVLL